MRDALGRNVPDCRRRQPATMSEEERARIIITLRRRKWSYQRIADKLGVSKSTVIATFNRHTATETLDIGEIEDPTVPPEQW
jgi:IS30 family transposase